MVYLKIKVKHFQLLCSLLKKKKTALSLRQIDNWQAALGCRTCFLVGHNHKTANTHSETVTFLRLSFAYLMFVLVHCGTPQGNTWAFNFSLFFEIRISAQRFYTHFKASSCTFMLHSLSLVLARLATQKSKGENVCPDANCRVYTTNKVYCRCSKVLIWNVLQWPDGWTIVTWDLASSELASQFPLN